MTEREVALLELLDTLAEHWTASLGLLGLRGGVALSARARAPKVGDLVHLQATGRSAVFRNGWLRAVLPDPDYGRAWLVEHLDGVTRRWANVDVVAVPVGDPYGDLLDAPDAVFQPD